jgi:hypothetical protein
MIGATLNDQRVTHARVHIPAWGCAYAEVSIDAPKDISGLCTLKVADLSLKCSVLSGGSDGGGRAHYRLVAGYGGWGKVIKKKSYANDAGVKLGTVFTDAATECGEVADYNGQDRLGPAWTRPKDLASGCLERLAPSSWYVGEDGKTRIGKRPSTKATVKYARGEIDRAGAKVTVAANEIASLLPGVEIEGLSAVDVMHELTPKRLRTTIWGNVGGETSRSLAALKALLEQLDPYRKFRATYEYRIVLVEGDRVSLQPVRSSLGMPDLRRVQVRPSVPGCKPTFIPGTRVGVAFMDADPARPFVVALEEVGGSGFKALNLEIDANVLVRLGAGVKPAAGLGDMAGPFPIATTQVKVLI